jgi:predicted secreted protein
VTFSDDSTATFTAIVGGYSTTNPLDDTVDFSASLKVTGAVTYAAS